MALKIQAINFSKGYKAACSGLAKWAGNCARHHFHSSTQPRPNRRTFIVAAPALLVILSLLSSHFAAYFQSFPLTGVVPYAINGCSIFAYVVGVSFQKRQVKHYIRLRKEQIVRVLLTICSFRNLLLCPWPCISGRYSYSSLRNEAS